MVDGISQYARAGHAAAVDTLAAAAPRRHAAGCSRQMPTNVRLIKFNKTSFFHRWPDVTASTMLTTSNE